MRFSRRSYLFLVVVFCSTSAVAIDLEHQSTLEGDMAYAFLDGSWQKRELVWRPEWVARWDSGARLTVFGEARLDSEDELDPGKPRQPFRAELIEKSFPTDHTELELREFYLDHYIGNTFFRLGKQQVVWGQADGLRVLDVVNPLSYREFIMPDIEHRRIPLWSAVAEVPVDEWTAQLVWVPDSTVTESTLPGGAFSLIPDPFGRGNVQANKPSSFDKNDFGLRLSSFQGGWDVSLNYLYHTVDDPLIRFVPSESLITANYNRSHLFGGTVSRPIGSITLRGEVGVETKKRVTDSSGTVRETEVGSYVIGVDYSGMRDWYLSGQFFQTYRASAPRGIRSSDEQLTFLLRHDGLNDALSLEVLAIYDLKNQDSLVQLEAEYSLFTNLVIRAGADLFLGDPGGVFGQFHDESRVSSGFTLSF